MLQTVKDYIQSAPEDDFGTFFQKYVLLAQDKLIDNDVKVTESKYGSLTYTSQLIAGINSLTEELKKL